MNKVSNETINEYLEEFNASREFRNNVLAAAYSGLAGSDKQLSPDVVRKWRLNEPIPSMTRSEILMMEGLTNAIDLLPNSDWRKPCHAMASGAMAVLLGKDNRFDMYMSDSYSKDDNDYIVRGIQYAQCEVCIIERKAALLFAYLCYPKSFGDQGIYMAAIVCDFYLTSNGVGSFVPEWSQVSWLSDAIEVWRKTDGSIFNNESQRMVDYISERCIWFTKAHRIERLLDEI